MTHSSKATSSFEKEVEVSKVWTLLKAASYTKEEETQKFQLQLLPVIDFFFLMDCNVALVIVFFC